MIYIFSGPTLSAAEGRTELDAVFLPPAAQGDVYRAAREHPQALGIIDGYFERVPSVWHKEILWAMSEGIHIYGSGSMGALRAAELAAFGMRGVGATFEAFLRGELEDDDEVAVMHGPAEVGFRALSEAMVNIRATLARAEREEVLSAETRRELERLAKRLHYPERDYPALLAQAAREGLPADELDGFRAWLPQGRVNQKHADALAMLRSMREELAGSPPPKPVAWSLSWTDAWEGARRECERMPSPPGVPDEAPALDSLTEELRVSGTLSRALQGALVRALAVEEARRAGYTVQEEELRDAQDAFRRERGLLDRDRFEDWLARQHLEDPEAFFEEEAQLRWLERTSEPDVSSYLPNYLRSTGEYGPLLERIRHKEQGLAESGGDPPG